MAYVALLDHPRKLVARLARIYGRRRFGRDTEPVRAGSHHSGVLLAQGLLEAGAGFGWKKLDEHTALLASQAVSGAIGCSWCIDFGYYESLQRGQAPEKVRDLPTWRDSDAYTDTERAVLEYAEAATATPANVTQEIADELHKHFTDEQIVELAAWVCLENYRSRFNAGLGLKSEGFSDTCRVPPPTPDDEQS